MRLGEKPLVNEKPKYVFDATPVIYFAKIGKLNLIPDICEAYITRSVYSEVTQRDSPPDALIIKDAVDRGHLKVYDLEDRGSLEVLLRHPEIHIGEAETMAAAKELKGVAIVDDRKARAIAQIYGIGSEPGTLFILFRLLSLGRFDVDEAGEILNSLLASGLYLDPKTLLRAQEKLEEYRRNRRQI